MSTRTSFDEELMKLKNLVLEMGEKAVDSLQESIEALVNQDVERALRVIDRDDKIDRINHEINEKAIWLVAKESPVATDLRKIFSSIKISTDLERIGDLAVDVAKSTIRIGKKELAKQIHDITLMAEKAKSMITEILSAYDAVDVNQARVIADLDNELDELYGKQTQELIEYMIKNPETQPEITQLLFVCRYLERVGDHATNISESIIFMKIGQLFDLNA